MKHIVRQWFFLSCFIAFSAVFAAPAPSLSLDYTVSKVITVDFSTPESVAYLVSLEGKILTSEIKTSTGIVFSGDASAVHLDESGIPMYQNIIGPANIVMDGKLHNPWLLSFSGRIVTRVEVTLRDESLVDVPQFHGLYAYGSDSTIYSYSFTIEDFHPAPYDLSFAVISAEWPSIDHVLLYSDPFGDVFVKKIRYEYVK